MRRAPSAQSLRGGPLGSLLTTAEVLGEELLGSSDEAQLAVLTDKAVALVIEAQVRVRHAALRHRLHQRLGLRHAHARVVGAMREEHGDSDVGGMSERRACPEEFRVVARVADAAA